MADKTIEYLKEELSKEEQLLESLIKSERFFKRHKKKLIAAVAVVALAVAGYYGYEYKKELDRAAANAAYERLLADPADSEARALLEQKSPALYRLYLYRQAVRSKDAATLERLAASKDPVIADLASYHLAALRRDPQGLGEYESGGILRDYARLDGAYLYDLAGRYAQAHSKLDIIPRTSIAKPYAILLRHYGVAK